METALTIRKPTMSSTPLLNAVINGLVALVICGIGSFITWLGLRQKARTDKATNDAAMVTAVSTAENQLRQDLFTQTRYLSERLAVAEQHSKEQDVLIEALNRRIQEGDKERAVLVQLVRDVQSEVKSASGTTVEELRQVMNRVDGKMETVLAAMGLTPKEGSIIVPTNRPYELEP